MPEEGERGVRSRRMAGSWGEEEERRDGGGNAEKSGKEERCGKGKEGKKRRKEEVVRSLLEGVGIGGKRCERRKKKQI